jgi:DNA polymerase III epsilon subunit-like protein
MTTDIIVFDTETTGLLLHPDADLAKQPRVVEFGAAILSGESGEILDTYNTLINPGIPIPEEASKISGIKDEDVKDAPRIGEVWPDIAKLFDRCCAMFSHNLPFDKGMMLLEIRHMQLPGFVFPEKEICTVSQYRELWGRNPKLTELYLTIMRKNLAQSHRALDDVLALVEIIQAEELWRL